MATTTKCRSLLTFLFLLLLQFTSAQECLYQYMHQPTQQLHCNPYGRQLQLHCGFIGPLSPEFNLEWYSGNATGSNKLSQTSTHANDYSISNIVLDMRTGHHMRSVSSILLTGPIHSEEHRGSCLWCRAEHDGVALSLISNALCIEDESRYTGLAKCNDAVLVNTSLICANVTKQFTSQFREEEAQLSKSIEGMLTNPMLTLVSTLMTSELQTMLKPSPSSVQAWERTSTLAKSSSHAYKHSPSSLTLHTTSLVTKAMAPSVTPTPYYVVTVAPTTAGTVVTPTDPPKIIKNEEKDKDPGGDGLSTGSNDMATPGSRFEGPLYAAVVICVVFVVIIVFLVVVIVCLSRKKCGCLMTWARSHRFWRKDAATTTDTQGHALRNTIVEGSDVQAMLECGLHGNNGVGYKEESQTDGPEQLQVRVSVERAEVNTSEQEVVSGESCSEEAQQQQEKRKSRTSNELPPPSLPPKPREVEHDDATDDPLDKHDYDHLEPAVDANHDDDNANEENEYAELENSVTKSLDTPPPKKPPRRSRSREHFYHTLESSDDSGLLRSANTSRGGSQLSGMNEYAEANCPRRESTMSSQLQELFDDPRYAMLFVDQEQQEQEYTPRREVSRSRSTPSLVSIGIIPFSPTVPERRSLRAPHQMRLLAVNPQHIHHHN